MPHNITHFIFNHWHIKVLSLISAILIVYFNNITSLETRVIAVPLEVRLPLEHVPTSAPPASVRVNLRGEGDEIVGILSEDIVAFIDLSGYDSAGVYQPAIQIERRAQAVDIEPLQITSDPATLSVRLEEKATKEVPVEIEIQGESPEGYQLTETRVAPPLITLTGPRNIIERTNSISTELIDITRQTSDGSIEAEIIISGAYVESLSGTTINVFFEVLEVPIEKTVDGVDINVANLANRFDVTFNSSESRITVSGTPSTLETLNNENVYLLIDAGTIRNPGAYILSTIPQIPAGMSDIEIVSYEPGVVPLQIIRR